MAWDDISWHIHGAVDEDKVFTRTELGFMFPKLLGHLIIDDEQYIKKREEYKSSIEMYSRYAELLKANQWMFKLIDDTEDERLKLANTYLTYADNCKGLLDDLDKLHNEYLEWVDKHNKN